MMQRNSRSSASFISWVSDGSFWPQYPRRRHLFINASSFARSPAEHGRTTSALRQLSRGRRHAATCRWYRDYAKRVARTANCKLLHDARTLVTWSADVSWLLTMTPRTRRVVTRSMSEHGGCRQANLPRLPRALMIISLDFERFSARLLAAAHAQMWPTSNVRVFELASGTTKYVSSANLNNRLPGVRLSCLNKGNLLTYLLSKSGSSFD